MSESTPANGVGETLSVEDELVPVEEGLVEVRISTPDAESARALAQDLVNQRFAACVQILGPMVSVYTWQGEAREATEWLMLVKTTESSFEALSAHVVAAHRYDTPEIVAVPISRALLTYDAWVRSAVEPAQS